MTNTTGQIVCTTIIAVVSAVIGWAAGYDFDTRNTAVAVWVGFTAVLMLMAWVATDDYLD